MKYLYVFGMMFILLGIFCLMTYRKEKQGRYIVVPGKVVDVIRTTSWPEAGSGYKPVIEYWYNGETIQVEHRVMTPKPSKKYRVGDAVEMRVYEDSPYDAIINDRTNLLLPLVSGIPLIVIGMVICVIWICLR